MASALQQSPSPSPTKARAGRRWASVGTFLSLVAGILVIVGFGCSAPGAGPDLGLRLSAGSETSWQGSLQLNVDTGAELDSSPPAAVSGAAGDLDHGDLFYDNRASTGDKLYTADHPMAVFPTAGTPDADGCQDAISTFGVWSIRPVHGQVICVQTTEGQIVALTVVQVQPDGVAFTGAVLG